MQRAKQEVTSWKMQEIFWQTHFQYFFKMLANLFCIKNLEKKKNTTMILIRKRGYIKNLKSTVSCLKYTSLFFYKNPYKWHYCITIQINSKSKQDSNGLLNSWAQPNYYSRGGKLSWMDTLNHNAWLPENIKSNWLSRNFCSYESIQEKRDRENIYYGIPKHQ